MVRCQYSINAKVKQALNQNQIDALHFFIFNVEVAGFEGSTLLRIINIDSNEVLIEAQFIWWDKGTINGEKVTLLVLKARRSLEARLYFS